MEVRGQTLGEEDGKGPLICSRFLGEAKFKAPGRQADRDERNSWNVANYEWEDSPNKI